MAAVVQYNAVVAAESGFGLDLVRRCQYPVGRRARLAGAPRRERNKGNTTRRVTFLRQHGPLHSTTLLSIPHLDPLSRTSSQNSPLRSPLYPPQVKSSQVYT